LPQRKTAKSQSEALGKPDLKHRRQDAEKNLKKILTSGKKSTINALA